ncbi:hypothetical protein A2U01_0058859, partial [Trifolium medium]|nr:hypothetical protein [Trifolium medium]
VPGALCRSVHKQQEFFLFLARRARQMARRAVESGTLRNLLWKLRVAQDKVARRAVGKFKEEGHNGYLRVVQNRWRGAPARECVKINAF